MNERMAIECTGNINERKKETKSKFSYTLTHVHVQSYIYEGSKDDQHLEGVR